VRPSEYSTEIIIQAGQQLETAGRNVTGFAIRQKIGGGNPARLKAVWDEHLAGQSAKTAQPEIELPDELVELVASINGTMTDLIEKLANNLHARSMKLAERRAANAERDAAEVRAQADQELADASLQIEELESGITQFEIERDVALDTAKNLQIELATLKAKSEAAELAHQEQRKTSAQEIHRAAERIAKLEADRDAARNEASSAKTEADKLQGKVELLMQQNDELLVEVQSG